ncbi:aldo/keto reductase [Sphingobacterium sp. UT-1RO-CII-1]|uniref:aldo/keto reductase n=1 Tax=Sphingobacterium sp. UT-1RO-CII-1 TaxID=2995225 RepID=UPI00227B9B17|nr:aldo/keto reductase [Sphingobacterium sp. UT-1RO-CII-1]MCY4781302.1 aldo/keto reductase [Sphingobacterium sp. UT-1RO-CII-1]
MQLINLGKSDLKVSPIAMGTMSLKGGSTKLNANILHEAYDLGINYFDTADLYERGQNETMLGQALSSQRDQVIYATKVGNQWRSEGNAWDWKASGPYIIKTVESSLTRLKTDYIDLYQLHGGMIEDPIEEIIDAFERLVESGKIRYYGLSSIRPNVIATYAERSNIVSVMMQYNLLDRRAEAVFPLLAKRNIGVVSRGALTQGMLIDKTIDSYLQLTSGEVALANRNVDRLADNLGVGKMTILLAYVLKHSAISAAALGIRTLSQLDDLKTAMDELSKMSFLDREDLHKGLRKLEYTDHLHS